MARSNLNISSALTEAFLSAQQYSVGTRCIKVLIDGETLILSSIIRRVNNAEADFDSLATCALNIDQATILLFCLSDQAIEKQKWLLASFIPDGCKVREKMLYSSSREDLKRALGLGFFSQDYYANTVAEMKWECLKAYMSNDHRKDEYLSEKEKMIRDEQILSHAESVFTKSTAMGILPFSATSELIAKLKFLRSSTEYNLIEMTITDEEIGYAASHNAVGQSLNQYVNAEEPRFLALCLPNESTSTKIAYLVFSCPESAPVRKKMIMSSAKATLLAIAADHGLIFDRTLEIHSPEELDEQIESDLSTDNAHANSSAAATITHSKPQRPGRGKGTKVVAKFTADSES